MTINTRPATSADINWLADLFTQSMRPAITAARGSWDRGREDSQFRAQLQIANTRVIRVDGDDVGFLTVHTLEDRLVELHTLCVQPGRQGAGIGARIMRDVMTTARKARSVVELSVLKTNTSAQRFYERLGFTKIDTLTHHIRMRWTAEEED